MKRTTYLAATFTHVRLLAGVYAGVHCQSTALDELLATAWVVADVWADAAVNAFWIPCQFCRLVTLIFGLDLPCLARSLRLAKPLEHVEQAKALGRGLLAREPPSIDTASCCTGACTAPIWACEYA